jgi:gliding motility-associated-like protein
MKKLSLFLFAIALFFNVNQAKASHYMGGEIVWECIPAGQPNAGKFIFTLKVYRECNGIQFGSTQTLQTTHPSVSSIPLTEITGWPKDISPVCNANLTGPGVHITCAGATANNTGAVEEHVYRSSPVQLAGVPPAQGWTFSWSSCCRNPSANVPNATSKGWWLRAKMYAYQNTNTYPCFDNSPTFAERPQTVICTGYPFQYNHNAFDKELDVLSFAWGQPMVSANNPLPFGFGYTYQSPLPGPAQNPNNVASVVDPNIGTISFTSYTSGAYVTSTKVTAYRCGVKIAEIWRDMQVVLLNCGGSNTPPTVTPPFNAGTSFVDTVYAGEYVSFALNAQDFQFLVNGSPQTMKIEVSGPQFGSFVPPTATSQATFSDSVGCLSQYNTPPGPCATLTPAPGPGYPLTGIFGVQTQFGWQTNCSHLATTSACGVTTNVYNFVMKVSDDYCPAPGINVATMTVVVLPKPTIPSPPIGCLEVLPSGDVKLTWSVVTDTMNTFDSYHILHSNNANGPFTTLDSIFDIGTNTYTHVGANANNAPSYYKVQVRAGCPGHQLFSPADTFSTIYLTAVNNMAGSANLNWNSSITPLPLTSTGVYNVERDYPSSNLGQIDTSSFFNYLDPITACGDDISYRISIADTGIVDSTGATQTCFSRSNVSTDYFSDILDPFKPVIDSVSVDPLTGFAQLAWDQNAAGDTKGYVIYLLINGQTAPIDTVWGDSNTTYIDQINSPCNPDGSFNTYSVAAFDSCGNISAFSDFQNTMNLKAVKDICDDKITLTWNSYNNMLGGLNHYDIYYSENGGLPMLLTTTMPGDTTYEHVGLNNGSTYCYAIRAIGDSVATSTSCVVCEIANKPNQPQFAYIRSASVITGNQNGVDLRLYTDTTAKVSLYRIERTDDGVNWNAIATLPPDYTNPNRHYIDPLALVLEKSYTYRFIVVDSCGDDAITSNVARTMLLKVNANDSLFNDISWSSYAGYIGVPFTYEVYRSVDGIWDPAPVITLPQTQVVYKDDVTSFKEQGGMFAYVVAALEGSGNTFQFADTSLSNSATALQKPRLYVPSAFDPNSSEAINRTFYPHGVFVNSKDYLFIVFNRWGEKVFETNLINHGWDGKFNGIDSPGDVYTYYVRFTSSSGYLFENRGTVTLIR